MQMRSFDVCQGFMTTFFVSPSCSQLSVNSQNKNKNFFHTFACHFVYDGKSSGLCHLCHAHKFEYLFIIGLWLESQMFLMLMWMLLYWKLTANSNNKMSFIAFCLNKHRTTNYYCFFLLVFLSSLLLLLTAN